MPIAYEGKEPYVFVSYSHKDKAEVLRYVDALEKNGFRVWFDGGVEVGSEWPEYIANHLANCTCVMAFVSKNFVDSENCRRELTLSQELKKGQLNIYIKGTVKEDLPMGMRLQLGLNQALFRSNFDSDEAFIGELSKAKMLAECRAKSEKRTKIVPPKENEPYVFVICAQKDQDEVSRYVAALQKRGVSVWYDSGLDMGKDWLGGSQEALKNSACVLSFLSPASVQSPWYKKELELAFCQNMRILPVYLQGLEPRDLPDEQKYYLGSLLSVFRSQYANEEVFIDVLCKELPLEKTQVPPSEKKEKKPQEPATFLGTIRDLVTDDGEEEKEEKKPRSPLEEKYAKKGVMLGWLGVILEILWLPLSGLFLKQMVLQGTGIIWCIVNLTVLHTIVFLISKCLFTVLAKRIKRDHLDLSLLDGPKAAIWAVCIVCSIIAIFTGTKWSYLPEAGYFLRLLASIGTYLFPVIIPFFGYLFLDET